MSEAPLFWLNVTNAALGIIVAACVLVLAYVLVLEAAAAAARRWRESLAAFAGRRHVWRHVWPRYSPRGKVTA